jgi:hypothetical protein
VFEVHSSQTGSSRAEQPDKLPSDGNNLINTIISAGTSYPELKLIQLKQSDKHGHIYKAKHITSEALFEIRVYSINSSSQQKSTQIRHAKRNCREWKERRRFLDSLPVNGFVFLILRYPEPQTVPPSPSGTREKKLTPHLLPGMLFETADMSYDLC